MEDLSDLEEGGVVVSENEKIMVPKGDNPLEGMIFESSLFAVSNFYLHGENFKIILHSYFYLQE